MGAGELVEGGRALAIELDIAAEVLGARREVVGEEVDEFFFVAGEEGVVRAALLADGGGAFGAHLAAAERAGAVGGIDPGVVGQLEEFVVQAVVEQAASSCGVCAGEIGTADVADEEGVAGEDRRGRWVRLGRSRRRRRFRWCGRESGGSRSELCRTGFVAVFERCVREGRRAESAPR